MSTNLADFVDDDEIADVFKEYVSNNSQGFIASKITVWCCYEQTWIEVR